jgi:hypothetical protein
MLMDEAQSEARGLKVGTIADGCSLISGKVLHMRSEKDNWMPLHLVQVIITFSQMHDSEK